MSFHHVGFIDENDSRQNPFDEGIVEPSAMESEYFVDGKLQIGARARLATSNGGKGKGSKRANRNTSYCACFCGILRSMLILNFISCWREKRRKEAKTDLAKI